MSTFTRREFLDESLLAAAAAAAVPWMPESVLGGVPSGSPRDVIRIGVIGVRGRGRAHVGAFGKSAYSEVVAICDPDEGVIAPCMKAVPKARYYRDVRKLLEDDAIDAVSIATPNHWHSLASIWALQARKHVYVEKPISHNVHEGRKVVEAARKYGKVVQHGTQARSAKATVEALTWLRGGGLGRVHLARGLCYKRRGSIGKVGAPQKPPATLDYDLWTGPAALQPLMREKLHYDWHWDFNTGSGDIGNQGVHQMDIARWGLGRDGHPTRVVSCGGRLGYDDDGNTPNTQIAVYDYGDAQIVFEVRGLKTGAYKGAHIGVVFHCEHGYLVVGSYSKVLAFDHDGKVMKTFTGGGNHFENFLEAVRADDQGVLNSGSLEGHLSSSLCHLGNASYRLGAATKLSATDTPFGDSDAGNEAFQRFRGHLKENGLDLDASTYARGPVLTFDAERERFTGKLAEQANPLITRPYRAPFLVPNSICSPHDS